MNSPQSLVERFLERVRNNRIAAALIIAGIVVTSLASFTDALRKLADLLPEFHRTDVAGSWESEALTDANTEVEYRYLLVLKTDGAQVYGSAARIAPSCRESAEVVCGGYGRQVAIAEGRLDGNRISFVCDWGRIPGKGPWTYVRTRETFRGTVDDGAIRFLVQNDQNSPPVAFGARKVAIGKNAQQ